MKLLALSAGPGRPLAPTATAFQPPVTAWSWCAASLRASDAMAELLAGRKNPMTFSVVGTGTTKTSSSANIASDASSRRTRSPRGPSNQSLVAASAIDSHPDFHIKTLAKF